MWWALLAWTTVHADPVDRVIADVSGELVLTSDIVWHDLLAERDPMATAFFSPAWGAPLSRTVDAAVIRRVASTVGIYTPSADAVESRWRAFAGTFESAEAMSAYLKRHRSTEAEVREQLRQRALVDRYLLRNVQSDVATPGRWLDEAQAHVAQLRARLRLRLVPVLAP